MTAPQIGNYGINQNDEESDGPKVAGFVVRELSPVVSNWRAEKNLDEYLKIHSIPGIEGIDTRALTKKIRVHGALRACLSTEDISDDEALERARNWSGIEGQDFVKQVTCSESYVWDSNSQLSQSFTVEGTKLSKKKNPIRAT